MEDIKIKSKEIVSEMTLDEKAAICSGKDYWLMKGIERLGLPEIMMTDGPHGLRKQEGETDNLGINESVPSTCFPPACTTACSFDEELLADIGRALAEECLAEGVSVLLGPGVNIKRSPLCGRNFEYISEDPYLTGRMASAIIGGMQELGVGASLKHFAANNQERYRMTVNSVVDERALREVYLRGFEMAIKERHPWTVMCSYNRINGSYACESKWLLTDVLRGEWGFGGAVVSDWGATNDRVDSLKAGMELEMPNSGDFYDKQIVHAVKTARLDEATLNRAATRLVELALKGAASFGEGQRYDKEAHHAIAKRAADASFVLLKNEGALPFGGEARVAVIGAFAKTMRYQGAGSSRINPTKLSNAYDSLMAMGIELDYADGYAHDEDEVDEELIYEACAAAKGKDVAVVFAGLPESYESESYDRVNMELPESHNRLIEAVCDVNDNVVVVLQLGAPASLPWRHRAKAILLTYLGGQAGGASTADILTGRVNPSGKLAESWPERIEDTPCFNYFPGDSNNVEYRESIFVGYRYYKTAGTALAYPFGHGLSYADFEYSDLELLREDGRVTACCTLKNTGSVAGSEVAQFYVGMKDSLLARAKMELRGFAKVYLEPGESKRVEVALDERCFSYFNIAADCWAVEGGEYIVYACSSSEDIRLGAEISVEGDGKEALLAEQRQKAPVYFELPKDGLAVSDEGFGALFSGELPVVEPPGKKHFTVNSTITDIGTTWVGRTVQRLISKYAGNFVSQNSEDIKNMMKASLADMPLRSLSLFSGGAFTPPQLYGLVDMLNGRLLKGLFELIRGISRDTMAFIKKYVFSR